MSFRSSGTEGRYNVFDPSRNMMLGRGGQRPLEGKQQRGTLVRQSVDFSSTCVTHIENRKWQRGDHDRPALMPSADFVKGVDPVFSYQNPAQGFCTKFIHTSVNKHKCAMHACAWTPEGRRLVTGSEQGELTLWNGTEFNFEHVEERAHAAAVRCLTWSRDDLWLVSGSDSGQIKYWQSSMTNVKAFTGHRASVRDVSFSPTSLKFATASDDQTIGVWDFETCKMERSLDGHLWEVKTAQWHATKGLIVSGSKDNTVRLWDPRAGENAGLLCTLYGHKNQVSKCRWNPCNGMWFLTAARDETLRAWDLRTLKPFATFRGHAKEVTCVEWHPYEELVFASGSYDGSVMFWLVDRPERQAETCGAHDQSVWDMAWHPLGHILATCSNDKTTRFWGRNRPGDSMRDKYNANQLPREEKLRALKQLAEIARIDPMQNNRGIARVLQAADVDESLLANGDSDDEKDRPHLPGLTPGKTKLDAKTVASLYEEEQKRSAVSAASSAGRSSGPRTTVDSMGKEVAVGASTAAPKPAAAGFSWGGSGGGGRTGPQTQSYAPPAKQSQNQRQIVAGGFSMGGGSRAGMAPQGYGGGAGSRGRADGAGSSYKRDRGVGGGGLTGASAGGFSFGGPRQAPGPAEGDAGYSADGENATKRRKTSRWASR